MKFSSSVKKIKQWFSNFLKIVHVDHYKISVKPKSNNYTYFDIFKLI